MRLLLPLPDLLLLPLIEPFSSLCPPFLPCPQPRLPSVRSSSSCPGSNQKMPPSRSRGGGGGLQAAAPTRKLIPRPAAQRQLVALHPALGPHPPGCCMPAACSPFFPLLLRLPSGPGSPVSVSPALFCPYFPQTCPHQSAPSPFLWSGASAPSSFPAPFP